MNRSVNKTMDEIFLYLQLFISEADSSLVKNFQRHIKPSGDETLTIDIVKRAILIKQDKESGAPILGFIYNDNKYIIVLSECENLFNSLSFTQILVEDNIELNEAAGMLAISNKILALKKGVDSIDIVNGCFGFDEDEKNCFNFEEIRDFFQPYVVFRVDNSIFSFDFIEDFNRLEALILLSKGEYNSLILQNNLKEFLLLESSRSLASSIINCLTSNQWEYTYLQLYHCLEYLFAVNNAIELKNKYCMSDISPAIDIASDSILKKSEKDSLIGVFNQHTPELTLRIFCKATLNYEDSNLAEKAADHVYKIRCNLAHLRFKQDALQLFCDEIVMLEEISGLIKDTYEKLDTQIVSICVSKHAWTLL